MYASDLDGQRLTFFVSGMLWGGSLVMEDVETGSLWSHILGRSMRGKLKDKELEIIPSKMTNWAAWKAQHPDTTVTHIRRSARRFNTEMLTKEGRAFGLGFVYQGKSRFWRFDLLKENPIVNDDFRELPLVVHFDAPSRTPVAWDRRIDNQVLEFRHHDHGVEDKQTQSQWDLQRGLAISGKLQGRRLKALPAIVSFTRAWQRFHPDSTYWQP